MTKTRREFTPEFKREAVALLESSGRPQMQIAAELGIQPSMLRQWHDADERLPTAAAGRITGSRARELGRISVRPGGRDRPPAA
jgi:transposase